MTCSSCIHYGELCDVTKTNPDGWCKKHKSKLIVWIDRKITEAEKIIENAPIEWFSKRIKKTGSELNDRLLDLNDTLLIRDARDKLIYAFGVYQALDYMKSKVNE